MAIYIYIYRIICMYDGINNGMIMIIKMEDLKVFLEAIPEEERDRKRRLYYRNM